MFVFPQELQDFDFWGAFWGRDPSGELRLEKSRWMAGSASESVTHCEENLTVGGARRGGAIGGVGSESAPGFLEPPRRPGF